MVIKLIHESTQDNNDSVARNQPLRELSETRRSAHCLSIVLSDPARNSGRFSQALTHCISWDITNWRWTVGKPKGPWDKRPLCRDAIRV